MKKIHTRETSTYIDITVTLDEPLPQSAHDEWNKLRLAIRRYIFKNNIPYRSMGKHAIRNKDKSLTVRLMK
jgi:hypothetical protein